MGGINTNLLVSILIVIAVFLLLREFWCWYFKLNKISNLLEDQIEEQKKSNELLRQALEKETNKNKQINTTNQKNKI